MRRVRWNDEEVRGSQGGNCCIFCGDVSCLLVLTRTKQRVYIDSPMSLPIPPLEDILRSAHYPDPSFAFPSAGFRPYVRLRIGFLQLIDDH